MGKIRTIKQTGNISRFFGQKTAQLVDVHSKLVKKVSDELKDYTGYTFPRKGTCIVATFIGDKGIPFTEIRPYSAASLLSLEKKLKNEVFLIDRPVKENDIHSPETQEALPLPQEENA